MPRAHRTRHGAGPRRRPPNPANLAGRGRSRSRRRHRRGTGAGRQTPDPGLLFARLSTAVRQAIALEARIAAGPLAFAARTPRGSAPRPPLDERRATIRQVLHDATEHHPDRTAFRKEIAERIEAEIAADPEGEIHMGDMLDAICEDLDIEINWNKVEDEILEKLTVPVEEGDAENPPDPPTLSEPWQANITRPGAGPH